jgi:hypothetical protein
MSWRRAPTAPPAARERRVRRRMPRYGSTAMVGRACPNNTVEALCIANSRRFRSPLKSGDSRPCCAETRGPDSPHRNAARVIANAPFAYKRRRVVYEVGARPRPAPAIGIRRAPGGHPPLVRSFLSRFSELDALACREACLVRARRTRAATSGPPKATAHDSCKEAVHGARYQSARAAKKRWIQQ